MISTCVVVETRVALCGGSVEVPSEEKSRMIGLTDDGGGRFCRSGA